MKAIYFKIGGIILSSVGIFLIASMVFALSIYYLYYGSLSFSVNDALYVLFLGIMNLVMGLILLWNRNKANTIGR